MGWHKLGDLNQIPEGVLQPFTIAKQDVVVWRKGSEVKCYGDFCTHQDIKLSEFGEVEGDELVCYAHGARFGICDGAPLCFPATEGLKTYPVKVEGDAVFIEMKDA